ncbi:MAG: SDR family oxidoreductase [Alphaproteobacteria bacterium]|nr:SDR family oxidoreductase [Alphaproteobacteria bacterium]
MAGRLKNRIAIVCGAGSIGPGWGNGKCTAIAFAREGATVLCVDRNRAAAEETASLIAQEGGRTAAQACDVTDEGQVRAMVAACLAAHGRIDILHNNVGIGALGGPVETDLATWQRVMHVNVTSMFLTCKHVLPAMLAQGAGAIVNVSSVSAIRAVRPEVAYTASKGAVNSLTQNIAMQYARQGIRCNAILPGLIDTPMVEKVLDETVGRPGIDAAKRQRRQLSPTGRMGEGWDVANAAVFLASDEARYVNGVLFPVDGGLRNIVAPAPSR